MNTLEFKSAPAEFKVDSSSSDWIVEGYASTWHVDEGKDQIHPGAYKKTVRERLKKNRIKPMWQHAEVMGVALSAIEDSKGLLTKSRISKTESNKERLTLIQDGAVDTMSIGYKVPQGKSSMKEGIRHIKEIILFEWSYEPFPMNEMAAVTTVQKHAQFAHMLKGVDRDGLIAYAKTFEGVDIGRIEEAMDALIELTSNIPTLTKDEEPSHEDTPDPDDEPSDGDQDPEEKAQLDALQSWHEQFQTELQLHDARRAINAWT